MCFIPFSVLCDSGVGVCPFGFSPSLWHAALGRYASPDSLAGLDKAPVETALLSMAKANPIFVP